MADEALRSFDGYARRIDADLRARIPLLATRIFEVVEHSFMIVIDPAMQNVAEIAEEFDSEIRFVATHIVLCNQVPETYLREIQGLSDEEAGGSLMGLPVPMPELDSLVLSRFPDLPIHGLRENQGRTLVVITREITDAERYRIKAFLGEFGLPVSLRFEVESSPHPERQLKDGGLAASLQNLIIAPARRRAGAPVNIADDEVFWFANLASAASGEMTLEHFPGLGGDQYRCFLDLSVGKQINLRQHLLLYDQIYCTLPLADRHHAFLADQHLSEADLLALVENGRLRFVSTQPEERLRTSFLEAAAERDRSAILGRRMTALILLADIARTAERYRLSDPELGPALQQMSLLLAPLLKVSNHTVARSLLWPVLARRQSLHGFVSQGALGGPAQEIGTLFAERVKAERDIDIKLEAWIMANRIHLGHALHATVFGAAHESEPFVRLMQGTGTLLNFYRGFNTKYRTRLGRERGETRKRGDDHARDPAVRVRPENTTEGNSRRWRPRFDPVKGARAHRASNRFAGGRARQGGRFSGRSPSGEAPKVKSGGAVARHCR